MKRVNHLVHNMKDTHPFSTSAAGPSTPQEKPRHHRRAEGSMSSSSKGDKASEKRPRGPEPMRLQRRFLHEISSGEEEQGCDQDSSQEEDVGASVGTPSGSDGEVFQEKAATGKLCKVHPKGPSQKTLLHYCGKQEKSDKRRASGAFRPGGLVNPGRPGVARSINAAKARIQQCNEWWDSKFRKVTRTSLPTTKAPRPTTTSQRAHASKCSFPLASSSTQHTRCIGGSSGHS